MALLLRDLMRFSEIAYNCLEKLGIKVGCQQWGGWVMDKFSDLI